MQTIIVIVCLGLLLWVEPASAVLLLLTGTYVVYYWLTLGGLLPA